MLSNIVTDYLALRSVDLMFACNLLSFMRDLVFGFCIFRKRRLTERGLSQNTSYGPSSTGHYIIQGKSIILRSLCQTFSFLFRVYFQKVKVQRGPLYCYFFRGNRTVGLQITSAPGTNLTYDLENRYTNSTMS